MTTGIHVLLRIAASRCRHWHGTVARRLLSAGHSVSVEVVSAPAAPLSLTALLELERRLFRRTAVGAASVADVVTVPVTSGAGAVDVIVDVSASGMTPTATVPVLTPLFQGAECEEAAAAALLRCAPVHLAVRDSRAPHAPWSGRPAIEDPLRLSAALDTAAARLGAMVVDAVARVAAGQVVMDADASRLAPRGEWTPRDSLEAFPREVARAFERLSQRAPHWYVGWRWDDGTGVQSTLALPGSEWHQIPDDGRRFLADPMPVETAVGRFVFVEEYPYATHKGIISVIPFDDQGPAGPPRPVLEEAWHLSYPFVFEDEGAWWMIPEASASGRVDLYRADAFPWRWERHATLLDGVIASDATVHRHDDGRLYLFATVAGDGASTWDALHVWWADDLVGPWRPVGTGAVLVDAATARPAGALFKHQTGLIRPVQDCSISYGRRLGLVGVERLSPDVYAQSIRAWLSAPASWACSGFHTLNQAGRLETVDGCRPHG